MKCKQPYPRFELGFQCSFSETITITPRASPTQIYSPLHTYTYTYITAICIHSHIDTFALTRICFNIPKYAHPVAEEFIVSRDMFSLERYWEDCIVSQYLITMKTNIWKLFFFLIGNLYRFEYWTNTDFLYRRKLRNF